MDTTTRPAYLTDETQIGGNDPALRDFWAEANRLATESGQCHVYDQLAKALGGPGREQEHRIYVNVSVPTYVLVKSTEDREDIVQRVQNNPWDYLSENDEQLKARVAERFAMGYASYGQIS